jgi:hypothetical protein
MFFVMIVFGSAADLRFTYAFDFSPNQIPGVFKFMRKIRLKHSSVIFFRGYDTSKCDLFRTGKSAS